MNYVFGGDSSVLMVAIVSAPTYVKSDENDTVNPNEVISAGKIDNNEQNANNSQDVNNKQNPTPVVLYNSITLVSDSVANGKTELLAKLATMSITDPNGWISQIAE